MAYDIYISHDTDDIYYVRVCDNAGVETVHRVTVTGEHLRDLGIGTTGVQRILQHAFLFLLDREAPQAILSDFSLTDITRYYPDFPEEIKRVLPKV